MPVPTTNRLVDPALAELLSGMAIDDPCARCGTARKRLPVNSVLFDVLDGERFLTVCDRFVACGRAHVVHFLAVHPTVAARQVERFRELLNQGDLVVSDGAPIAAVMRASDRTARRLTSTDAFHRLCDVSSDRGLRHFFVGGASEMVAERLLRRVAQQYPKLRVVGHEVPPFRSYSDDEVSRLASVIKASCADVVWLGIGAPKQEVLAHRLRSLDAAPVIACVGATFDFVAGTKPRAPAWLRALGLEWLFRLVQEPRRLWRRYLIGNARFLGGVAIDELRRPRPSEANGGN